MHHSGMQLTARLGRIALAVAFAAALVAPSVVSAAPASCGTNVQCIIQFGQARVTERLGALNTLNGKLTTLNTHGLLPGSDFSTLQGNIQTNESGLNNLAATFTQSPCDATAAAERGCVGNVYTQFRIFAVVIPVDYATASVDIISNECQRLTNLNLDPMMTAAINASPSSIQGQLTQYKNTYDQSLAACATDSGTAASDLSYFTVQNFDTNKSTYQQNWSAFIATEHQAHKDIHSAAAAFHAFVTLYNKHAQNG